MSTCKHTFNGELLATGMPDIKNFLFNGGLERFLPGMDVPKLVGQVDGGVRFSKRLGDRLTGDLFDSLPEQNQLDREYFNAVAQAEKTGDWGEVQKMVAEAAEQSGLPVINEADVTAYKVRRISPPKKTQKAYKLFRVKKSAKGDIFALFVGNKDPLPQDVWLDAIPGEAAINPKTGEATKVKSSLGALAFRPGWHAGDIPLATHIGAMDKEGNIFARKDDEVWAEVEMADDMGDIYQDEAVANGTKNGKFSAAYADIKYMPENGLYRYKTNPNMTGQWIISGSMKINRILSENEVNDILLANNAKTMAWAQEVKPTKEQAKALKESDSRSKKVWVETKLDLEKWGLTSNPAENQRKLLDPITRDNNGNIIPLSERFDRTKSDPRFSKTTPQKTGSTIGQVKSWLPKQVTALLNAGKLKVVQSAGESLEAFKYNDSGIEGYYDPKADIIYLIADNISEKNVNGVISHELVHRSEATDPLIQKALNHIESSIQSSFDNAAKGVGSANDLAAYQRVIEAQTAKKDQLSEFIAYKVTAFLSNPKNTEPTIANAIKGWLSAIKVFLLRNGLGFSFIRSLSESDFVAMSRYGARVNELQGNVQVDGIYASTTDSELESLVKQYASESGAPTRAEMAEALRQYREVEAKYFNADGTSKAGAMTAPNGKPTNLNKVQWIQVRTENFKNFFGDWENNPESASKVVDDNGDPAILYHATGKDFNQFDNNELGGSSLAYTSILGHFFADKKIAELFTKEKFDKPRSKVKEGASVMPVFLNIKNPQLLSLDSLIPEFPSMQWMRMQKLKTALTGKSSQKIPRKNGWETLSDDKHKKDTDLFNREIEGFREWKTPLFGKGIRIADNPDGAIIMTWNETYGEEPMPKGFIDTVSRQFIAFSPNQIKSATGNTGSFGTNSNDIRFSRSITEINDIIDSGHLTEEKRDWQASKDAITIAMVDSTLPLKRWAEKTFKDDPVVSAAIWRQYDLSPSRSQAYMDKMNKRFKNKLAESIRALNKKHPKVDNNSLQFELGIYASAQYALSENQQWLNYTPAELQNMIDKLETKYGKNEIETALKPLYAMNQQRLKDDIVNGKLSQAKATPLQSNSLYVPLLLDAGLSDSFNELEATASFIGFIPFKDSLKDAYDYAVGIEGTNDNNLIKEKYGISLNKGSYTVTDELAKAAMNTMNVEKTPTAFKYIKQFTSFQSRMVTLFMMGFAPTNMIRDVLERTENLRSRKIAGEARYANLNMDKIANTAIMNALGNLKDIKSVMMSVLAENTPLEKLFKLDTTNQRVMDKAMRLREFLSRGASSTYGDMLNFEHATLAEDLRKRAGIPHKLMDGILLWNNAFELISVFSIYQALIENNQVGLDDAAETSLNLMNFHKSGRFTSPICSLFLFVNPILQGGSQLYQTLSTKKGAVRFAVMTVIAAMLYSMLRGADGDDDELGFNRMDRSGNFKLYRNIRIPLSLFGGKKGEYFDIPMGFGANQLSLALGVNLTRMNEGDMTAKEFFYEGATVGLKAVAPISPAESNIAKNPAVWLAQTLTPQFLKPIINIGLNVNAFGGNLTNDKYMKLDTPKSEQGMRNTPPEYKDAAQWLFKTAGIDMYPEQIRELLKGYGAGLPNELAKIFIDNPAKETRGLKTADWYSDRWLAVTNDSTLKQTFYYELREKTEAAQKMRFENPDLAGTDLEMAELGDILKKNENHVKGKYAAATKAEKHGQETRAEFIRKLADKQKTAYEDFAIKRFREIEKVATDF